MNCPNCNSHDVPDGASFCPHCGEAMPTARLESVHSDSNDFQVAGKDFTDFQLRAWLRNDRLVQVMVHNSPAGGMRQPVEVPVTSSQLLTIREQFGEYWLRNPSVRRQWLVQAGRVLAHILLPPPVFTLLIRSLDTIAPDGLRIRLCLDEALVDLPWEYLYRPDLPDHNALAGFLALDPRISLVREPPLTVAQTQVPAERQRVLFVGVLAGGSEDVWKVKEEYRLMRDALEDVEDLLVFEYVDAAGEDFHQALLKPVSIFHYAGHTDSDRDGGFLVQELNTNADGTTQHRSLASETLAYWLRQAGVKVAVFSACNSGRWPFVQPLIQAGLPVIIGTQGPVSVKAANAFCHKLYASLAVGLSLDEAVTWARLYMMEKDESPFGESLEWGTFMIYMPVTQAVLFPQTGEGQLQHQERVRQERKQTIINVYQTIQSVSGGEVYGVYSPNK